MTRPEYDDTTKYLSCYAKLLIKEAEKNRIVVKDFKSGNVKRKKVAKFIKKQNPKLIFFNGHGNSNLIEGDKGEVLIKENENDTLLIGKITYARACFATVSLGKKYTAFLDTCFIGYNIPFSFWIDETWCSNPIKDKTAALYLIPSNELISYLIKGNTVEEAVLKSKNAMIESMRNLLSQKKEPGVLQKFRVLWDNFKGQEVCGNDKLSF